MPETKRGQLGHGVGMGPPVADDPRLPPMRFSAALALLLMLPGLLLPAGLLLRICKCAESMLGVPPAAMSCCAKAKQPAQPATPSCCQQHDRRERAPAGDDAIDTLDAVPCKCIWVKLTDRQPDPVPLPPALDFDFHAPLVASLAVSPQHAEGQPLRWLAADNRPPPPDRERNLPLLL